MKEGSDLTKQQHDARDELAAAVERIEHAIEENDWRRAGKVSHALAGYFGAIGNTAEKLAYLHTEIEAPVLGPCGFRVMHTDRPPEVCYLDKNHTGDHACRETPGDE